MGSLERGGVPFATHLETEGARKNVRLYAPSVLPNLKKKSLVGQRLEECGAGGRGEASQHQLVRPALVREVGKNEGLACGSPEEAVFSTGPQSHSHPVISCLQGTRRQKNKSNQIQKPNQNQIKSLRSQQDQAIVKLCVHRHHLNSIYTQSQMSDLEASLVSAVAVLDASIMGVGGK